MITSSMRPTGVSSCGSHQLGSCFFAKVISLLVFMRLLVFAFISLASCLVFGLAPFLDRRCPPSSPLPPSRRGRYIHGRSTRFLLVQPALGAPDRLQNIAGAHIP